jgi:hypothetical protein
VNAPRRPSLPSIPATHGLWSLWDMLELKAGAFVSAAFEISGLASFIAGRSMDAGDLKIFKEDETLDKDDKLWLDGKLDHLPEHLATLNADVALLCVKDTKDLVARSWVQWKSIKDSLEQISKTMERELSLKTILVLQPEEVAYFAPKKPLFGQTYAEKFQTDGAFELDEAAKCLALSRPTASVFHLMRILELGIGAMSKCLEIRDPVKPAERNWAIILKKIKEDGIEKKWPTAADRMTGDGLLFESLHASLDAVKNPWRNEAMHVVGKYTEDEAKHIFVAVEGFMRKLSSRMDEKGEPKA